MAGKESSEIGRAHRQTRWTEAKVDGQPGAQVKSNGQLAELCREGEALLGQ